MDVNSKDIALLSAFRSNARKTLTLLSRELGVPVSTIFEKIKKYENQMIVRYTTLLNFERMGYTVRVNVLIKAERTKREELERFLAKHENINTLTRVSNGYDYVVEAVFRSMQELHVFNLALEAFDLKEQQELYILDDMRREDFLRTLAYPIG